MLFFVTGLDALVKESIGLQHIWHRWFLILLRHTFCDL